MSDQTNAVHSIDAKDQIIYDSNLNIFFLFVFFSFHIFLNIFMPHQTAIIPTNPPLPPFYFSKQKFEYFKPGFRHAIFIIINE